MSLHRRCLITIRGNLSIFSNKDQVDFLQLAGECGNAVEAINFLNKIKIDT
jgi:hypothetical protein